MGRAQSKPIPAQSRASLLAGLSQEKLASRSGRIVRTDQKSPLPSTSRPNRAEDMEFSESIAHRRSYMRTKLNSRPRLWLPLFAYLALVSACVWRNEVAFAQEDTKEFQANVQKYLQ